MPSLGEIQQTKTFDQQNNQLPIDLLTKLSYIRMGISHGQAIGYSSNDFQDLQQVLVTGSPEAVEQHWYDHQQIEHVDLTNVRCSR